MIKRPKKKKKWIKQAGIGFLVIILLVLGIGTYVAVIGEGEDDKAGGLSACSHFRNILEDAKQGILTNTELRDKLKEVQGRASTAEPEIRSAASRMLATITRGQVDALVEAALDMVSACDQYGY